MVKIRFRRVGLKGQPSYRIVVTDSRKARNGGFIEIIGNHNPRTQPTTNKIDEERALYWLNVGAQPTDAVRRVLEATGTWARYERLRKSEATLEQLVAEAAAAPAPVISGKTSFPAPVGTPAKAEEA